MKPALGLEAFLLTETSDSIWITRQFIDSATRRVNQW
jgi:hypothetical protein